MVRIELRLEKKIQMMLDGIRNIETDNMQAEEMAIIDTIESGEEGVIIEVIETSETITM